MILGCTHFPLIAPMLQRILGRAVTLVSSGPGVARSVERALAARGLLNPRVGEGSYRFRCTGAGRGLPGARHPVSADAAGRGRARRAAAPGGGVSAGPERSYGRAADQLRPATIEPGFVRTATGSALISMGETRVICTASVQESVPRWLAGSGRGWVTAEYGMLPASTGDRKQRDITKGRAGRSHRGDPAPDRPLAARAWSTSRRSASGRSTSTATCSRPTAARAAPSITGGMVALRLACDAADRPRAGSQRTPLTGTVAAVSCGIVGGVAAARPRLLRGLDRRGRRQRRHDRRRRAGRGSGHGGADPALARPPRRPAGARRARDRRPARAAGRDVRARRAAETMPRPASLVLATRNPHKLREFGGCWPRPGSTSSPAGRHRAAARGGGHVRGQRPAQGAGGGGGDRRGRDRRRLRDRGRGAGRPARACARLATPGRRRPTSRTWPS